MSPNYDFAIFSIVLTFLNLSRNHRRCISHQLDKQYLKPKLFTPINFLNYVITPVILHVNFIFIFNILGVDVQTGSDINLKSTYLDGPNSSHNYNLNLNHGSYQNSKNTAL